MALKLKEIRCLYRGFGGHENKVDGQKNAAKSGQMIPLYFFILESDQHKCNKYDQGDSLLQNFQLGQGKGTSISTRAHAIGWHLQAIFEKGHAPADQNNAD
jgi:hypothetical protein